MGLSSWSQYTLSCTAGLLRGEGVVRIARKACKASSQQDFVLKSSFLFWLKVEVVNS